MLVDLSGVYVEKLEQLDVKQISTESQGLAKKTKIIQTLIFLRGYNYICFYDLFLMKSCCIVSCQEI